MNKSIVESIHVIAVDIGTTSTKVILVSRNGTIRASYNVFYPLHTPKPDRAEQDPEEIFLAVMDGIRIVTAQLDPSEGWIGCVSFSSAMHSLIAIDQELRPLTPCITWADNRGAELAQEFKTTDVGQAVYRRTGTPIHPMSPLIKLMWLKKYQPATAVATYKYVGIKEFVLARLFNRVVIDVSLASATGLFHSELGDWDEEAMDVAGIRRDLLPELVPVTHCLTGLNAGYAETLGLDIATPFVVGASDGVLANLGIGASNEGICACTIGTSGAVRTVWSKPRTDVNGRLFCYKLLDDYWVGGGAVNNGGIVLQWMKEQLAHSEAQASTAMNLEPLEYVTELVSDVPIGSEGLLFLPFLAGERAPYYNANARAAFFGLSLYHTRNHMFRAMFEGVMFQIRSVFEALEDTGGKVKMIRASGGFAKSSFWCQMLADMVNTPVSITDSVESSCLGAAMVGLLAIGEIDSFDSVQDWIHITNEYQPRQRELAVYSRLYNIYQDLYHNLKQSFDAISAYQNELV